MLHGAMVTKPLISEERDGTVKPEDTNDHCHSNADEADNPADKF
jgi:hypothetical protein